MKHISLEQLRRNKYKDIINFIKFESSELIEELFDIALIDDIQDKELKLEEFLNQHKNNKRGLFLKTIIEFEKRNWKKSKVYLEQFIAKYPDEADAYCNLATTFAQLELYNKAIQYYKKAISLNKEHYMTYVNLGNIYDDILKKQEKAIEYYEQALKYDKENTFIYYNLAVSLAKLGEFDKAISNYEHALRINPDYAEAHYNLANILNESSKNKGKIEFHYKEAIRIRQLYPDAIFDLATFYLKNKNYDKALIIYEDLLIYDFYAPDVLTNLGYCYLITESNYSLAKYFFEKAIRFDPNYADAYWNLSYLFIHMEKEKLNPLISKEFAKEYYLKCIQIDPLRKNVKMDNFYNIK